MPTATFDAKKLSLMELVMAINTESTLDKVLCYVRQKMNESNAKKYEFVEEEPMMLREETIEAIREAQKRKVYESNNLFSSSEELFKALDAE